MEKTLRLDVSRSTLQADDELRRPHDGYENEAPMVHRGTGSKSPQINGSTWTSDTALAQEADIEANSPDAETLTITPTVIKVARSDRRGLLGQFTILVEIEEPKNYPRSTKWGITGIVALAAIAAPLGSGILFPSLLEVSEDLHTSPTTTNLTVAMYMLSMAIFPLWWSSFSETLGRRTIYVVSFSLFLVLNIAAAESVNIAMLIIFRVLSGGAAASVQAVGAGTIADIWEPKERGAAMGYFYLGPLMGPLLAPIIGGALAKRFGWRSTQWFLVIYGAILLVLLILMFPETLKARKSISKEVQKDLADAGGSDDLRPVVSRNRSACSLHQKTKKTIRVLKRIFLDPLKIVLHLRFPAVLLTVYYASITFGSLYVLNISIQSTFAKPPYNFSSIQVGLAYLPGSIGYIVGSLLAGRWVDKIMAREARKARRKDASGKILYIPEDRMRENAWLGAALYPAAMLWYGWTAEKGLHWAIPLTSNFVFGVGSMLIFNMATTMLTEFMPKRSSEGVATNNFIRNIFSCIGGIIAQPLLTAIGNGWLFTALSLIAGGSSILIWVMRRYGPRWRINMDAKLNQRSNG